MGLEVVTYISDFNIDWPLGTDIRRFGDDHIRNTKKAPQNTFSGFLGSSDPDFEVMIRTQAELNSVVDRVLRAGDTMTGALKGYSHTPLDDLEFVTKKWVQDLYNGSIPGGGTGYNYGITEMFTSSEQLLAANTPYIVAHGLTKTPSEVYLRLRCTAADNGWDVDDVITISGAQSNDTDNNLERGGIQVGADATNIGWVVGDRAFVLARTTGNFVQLTLSSWQGTLVGYIIE